MDYKESGVDVAKGDQFVSNISKFVRSTYTDRVVSGIGGFAALYDMQNGNYLASATDGVGTKLKLAHDLKIHDTIGQDLVAMCVNDLICTGARPLFFLDYLATGKLHLQEHEAIIRGISNACLEAKCALIGGESAEMPGFYQDEEYDLAGFAVGEVKKTQVLHEKVCEGDTLIGISSSGFHSNGFSLVRKLIQDHEQDLKKQCLTPTRLYVQLVMGLLAQFPDKIHGISHITGGGLYNISRMDKRWSYQLENFVEDHFPQEMEIIFKRSKLSFQQLIETFNMGMGLVIAVDHQEAAKVLEECVKSYPAKIIGSVQAKNEEKELDLSLLEEDFNKRAL